MIRFNVQLDPNALAALTGELTAMMRGNLQAAVRLTAEEAAHRWRVAVQQAHLWGPEKQAYIESIRWEMDGPLTAWVGTDYRPAQAIETGRPAKDLKLVLRTARKARAVKSGKHAGQKYLIIPFRHNTPTASGVGAHAKQMPPAIYARAKALNATRITQFGDERPYKLRALGIRYFPSLAGSILPPNTRLSATGHIVAQHTYAWGERLPSGLAPKAKPHHVTDLYAGMVRMDTSSGRQKSSAYLTFRTMGEWSAGWIVPAKPGLHLARSTAETITPVFNALIARAIAP